MDAGKATFLAMILAAGSVTGAWAQQGQTPLPPDPTGQSPSTPAQSTPPTFPKSEKAPSPGEQSSSPAAPSERGKGNPVIGKITEVRGHYVLRAEGIDYKLDDESRAKQFNGKNVSVSGELDKQSNTIHLEEIREVRPR